MAVVAALADWREMASPVPTSKGRNISRLCLVPSNSVVSSSSYRQTCGIIITEGSGVQLKPVTV